MIKKDISEIVRQADETYVVSTPSHVWERVEAGLDAAPSHTGLEGKALPHLSIVHKASRQRAWRLLSIAASLLILISIGWWISGTDSIATANEGTVYQENSARKALEGPLELEGESSLTIRADIYKGVVIKNGDLSTSELKVCSPC